MATFADGKIDAYAGPTELGAPDDLEQVIVDFIGGAKDSLDIAVQELDSEAIAQAILDARWRGVSVKVVLEQDYLCEKKPPTRKPAPAKGEAVEDAVRRWQWAPTNGGLSENRRIATALLQSGIDVRADYNPKIFHLKFILRDYRPGRGKRTKPSAALLSGSTNFTVTGTHANLNHVFVFHDTRICAEYRLQYDEVEQGEFGRRGLGAVPRCHNLNGVPVKVLFAPDNVPSRR